ncbi:MAG TPA: uracil-DNA glycosylase family protein, partial [Chthoniobacterales bacterium]
FPGKASGGGDRVPSPNEISKCSSWLSDEFEILRPRLVIPVGRLAIAQFITFQKLDEVIGREFRVNRTVAASLCEASSPTGRRLKIDLIPLPHPSGASPWHKLAPGKELLAKAMRKISRHPAIRALR